MIATYIINLGTDKKGSQIWNHNMIMISSSTMSMSMSMSKYNIILSKYNIILIEIEY